MVVMAVLAFRLHIAAPVATVHTVAEATTITAMAVVAPLEIQAPTTEVLVVVTAMAAMVITVVVVVVALEMITAGEAVVTTVVVEAITALAAVDMVADTIKKFAELW